MRFYIFGGSSPNLICKTSQCKFETTNYEEAIEAFNKGNLIYEDNHRYLIVDFDNILPKGFFDLNKVSSNDFKDSYNLPFLIIGEFHYNPETNECNMTSDNGKIDLELTIRNDKISLVSEGFVKTFYNNDKAIREFLSYVDGSSPVNMHIDIIIDGEEMHKFVVSSVHVIKTRNNKPAAKAYEIIQDAYKAVEKTVISEDPIVVYA